MKLMNLLFFCMLYTNNIQTEQQNTMKEQGITIHIDASTKAQLPQINQTSLTANHTSKPSNNIETIVQAENQQSRERITNKLKPSESYESRFVRNGVKLGIAVAACYISAPFAIAYGLNRFIVQPLLGNGDIKTKISQDEQKKYEDQGLEKEPDLNIFPIFEKIKNSR